MGYARWCEPQPEAAPRTVGLVVQLARVCLCIHSKGLVAVGEVARRLFRHGLEVLLCLLHACGSVLGTGIHEGARERRGTRGGTRSSALSGASLARREGLFATDAFIRGRRSRQAFSPRLTISDRPSGGVDIFAG